MGKPIPPSQRQRSLIPDYLDDPNSVHSDERILPSFIDLKRKTLQSLYGLDRNKDYNHALLMDKSPKGSVDEGIRSLVDLINAHPSYATLSSCSGRISLFDPNYEATISGTKDVVINASEESEDSRENEGIVENVEAERVTTAAATGKGHGAWLISSHATITPSQLTSALAEQAKSASNHALTFKHEPLLLHVAASNLSRARQLLKLALDLGFRESGTVITPKRITVAIRSHSLALTVPIASKGRLRPNIEFLEELVREANERFHRNEEKLNRLEAMVENILFRIHDEKESISQGADFDSCDFTALPLPELNLWGHTAVVVPETDAAKIVVFGGYGAGPNGKKKTASRSNKMYSLCRNSNKWDDVWVEIEQEEYSDDSEDVKICGIRTRRTKMPAREGCASCVLPQTQLMQNCDEDPTLLAIFGGRSSPAKPTNELLLVQIRSGVSTVVSPIDISGDKPSPRWGHSLTPLSGEGGRLAILIGGRNESGVESSIHVLRCNQSGDEGHLYLRWEKIPQSIPRFYHDASHVILKSIPDSRMDQIIVHGGLTSTALIPGMTGGGEGSKDETNKSTPSHLLICITDKECTIRECEGINQIVSTFGAAICTSPSPNTCSSSPCMIMIRSGGISCNAREGMPPPIEAFKCSIVQPKGGSDADIDQNLHMQKLKTGNVRHSSLEQEVNFGTLVHHSSLLLPPSTCKGENKGDDVNLVLVGGGVPTFAFGQSFAGSFQITVSPKNSQTPKTNHINSTSIQSNTTRSKPQSKKVISKSNGNKSEETNVIYVHKKNAKQIKLALEEASLLDRNYRMVKADFDSSTTKSNFIPTSADVDIKGMDPASYIAVPVTEECLAIVSRQNQNHDDRAYAWHSLIHASGKQVVPYSSVVLGRR